jgi:threonine dehydrogenase-like Zn-dependent dehydrogenase
MQADKIGESCGPMDLIVDASGIAPLEFNLLDALDIDGAYVLTGIQGGDRAIQIPGASLIRQLVLKNQLMLGSVNAARGHFQTGANHLQQAHLKWGALLDPLVTQHYTAEEFIASQDHHEPNSIKQVVEWTKASPRA